MHGPNNARDVFGSFIQGLQDVRNSKKAEAEAAQQKVEDQYKADANMRANAEANRQMGILSGGNFPTVASYAQGLRNIGQQVPQAQTPQDVVPFTPEQLGSNPNAYNRPMAPEADVQRYMKDVSGIEALVHPEKTVIQSTDQFGNVTYQPTAKGITAPKTTVAPNNKSTAAGGAGAAELSPEAQQMIGQTIVDSGAIPPGLARSSKMAAEGYNSAAAILKKVGSKESLAEKHLQYTAEGTGRNAAGRQAALSQAYESTAKDVYTQVALPLAQKMDNQGNDMFSRWRRAKITNTAMGDEDMKNFDAAVNNIMLDYSKVQLGAAASASELSAGAQERTKTLLDSTESLSAFTSRMENVILPDMEIRQKNLQKAAGFTPKGQKSTPAQSKKPAADWTDFDPNKDYTK